MQAREAHRRQVMRDLAIYSPGRSADVTISTAWAAELANVNGAQLRGTGR